MESLPEDVILLIFSFLPPRDLLISVRAVCRTWRTLALQRDAWKYVTLSCWEHVGILERALRLVPCLYSLEVDDDCSPEVQQAMATSSCQVQSLYIINGIEHSPLSLLRQQVRHTKYLNLEPVDDAAEIFDLILDMALVELYLDLSEVLYTDKRELLVDRPFRNSCLKKLLVRNCHAFDLLIASLVTENAASLQEFACFDRFVEMPLTWKAVRALNCGLKLKMPADSLLDINGIENPSALAVGVYGYGPEETEAERQGLSALSKGLICASSLTFYTDLRVPGCRKEAVSICLQEMGTLGRCGHIESLEFQGFEFHGTELVTLSRLPNLRQLRLFEVPLPGPWLDAIEGLKSLQLLELGSRACNIFVCSVPALRRLIARMPGLHIIRRGLHSCCLKILGLLGSDQVKPYGLRGHCRPECALCTRHWHAIGGRWITVSSTN